MFTVYKLIDPRDSATRYVGVTVHLATRVFGHETEARGDYRPSPKDLWIRELLAAGLRVEAEELERFGTREAASDGERHWIAKLRAEGHALTNRGRGGLGRVPRMAPPPMKWSEERKAIFRKQIRGRVRHCSVCQSPSHTRRNCTNPEAR